MVVFLAVSTMVRLYLTSFYLVIFVILACTFRHPYISITTVFATGYERFMNSIIYYNKLYAIGEWAYALRPEFKLPQEKIEWVVVVWL